MIKAFEVCEYKTLTGNSEKSLDNEVNNFLKAGWKLYKNPYGIGDESENYLFQAMVKYKEVVKCRDFT
jgi:hypothetical protein